MKHLNQETLEACPLCANNSFSLFLEAPDFLTNSGNYSIVKCSSCHLLFTNPRPTQKSINSYYSGIKYYSHVAERKSFFLKVYSFAQSLMLWRKYFLIRKIDKAGATILDVGCGIGKFADYVGRKKYDVDAIEPDENARIEAQKKGLRVFENFEEYKKKMVARPKIITLWHVLEHQHNYIESFVNYSQILDHDGRLVIAVPQHQSFDAGFYKSDWAAYDLPRHLFHFNRDTLIASAKKAGFVLDKTQGMPFDSFYISYLSEKNRNSILGILRAPVIGIISNLVAIFKIKPWSSQIFVFKKGSAL